MSNSGANGTNLVGSNGLLVSWKQIAAHLGHTVRTVQRWEREAQLPVHRRGTDKKPTIFAYESELDAWLNQNAETATSSGASVGGDRRVVWLVVAALVVAIAGIVTCCLKLSTHLENKKRQKARIKIAADEDIANYSK